MQIPLDYHIHTTFSEDGDDDIQAMCRQAISLGIPEIGFSEHWDVGPYETNPRFLKPEPWFAEIKRLRTLFAGVLTIRAGIEIGEPHLYPAQTEEILGQVPFDYVLGSVHFVGEISMFDDEYFHSHTADEVYSAYFAELERMVSSSELDIVAHFDIPARNGKTIFGYEPLRYDQQIRSVLEICIARNLALDVNVSGLRKPSQIIMPDPLILKWYAEMGGKRVTLGSDAHRVAEVGLHLDAALRMIQDAGIQQIIQFVKRQPRALPV